VRSFVESQALILILTQQTGSRSQAGTDSIAILSFMQLRHGDMRGKNEIILPIWTASTDQMPYRLREGKARGGRKRRDLINKASLGFDAWNKLSASQGKRIGGRGNEEAT